MYCTCVQYLSKDDDAYYAVNRLIEKAVSDAEASGARVVTLGLLNQVRHLPLFIRLCQPTHCAVVCYPS
jgi:hypothetical protein